MVFFASAQRILPLTRRGAQTRQRPSGTAVAATNDSFGRSELQLP
jgi:hypothetical protein